ncbi:probable E3 ubiquitin-protein ligase ATL44 [Punica granatum]|uniref:RING-type E3 ubiquitin transferase n=1 Tax=Punica granatum TaxID=22663 RepID=A0A218WFD5_PUNGR|nr:probable E3 ubiquitin-protein ligase ATL44 [Punica granatum]XP_031379559.1 probable E3 ubiquitin-protein ligase ATL44 [Punica granatum]OWM71554.1 hypothetical protein CDL15_Pgr005741 [Punica granatum]
MMPIITIVILIFAGIVMLILAHVCMIEWIFRRGLRNNNNDGAVVGRSSRGNMSMSKDDVEKLPCFDFISKEASSANGSPLNCAVCLESFKVGERCRLLPICSHSFHAECVDAWLLKRPSCPICRNRVDSGRFGPVEGSSGHFSSFSLSNMESQGTESSRFSDSRSDLIIEDPISQSSDGRLDNQREGVTEISESQ